MSDEEREDLKEATNWLSALDINSEWEASNKETILSTIDKLQKEVEEKTTIIMAGADKVRALEKENKKLKKESKNSMKARNIIAQEVFRLQKQQEEKDKEWKDKIKKLKEKIHSELDTNGMTRAYQLIIDKYFDELLEGE